MVDEVAHAEGDRAHTNAHVLGIITTVGRGLKLPDTARMRLLETARGGGRGGGSREPHVGIASARLNAILV